MPVTHQREDNTGVFPVECLSSAPSLPLLSVFVTINSAKCCVWVRKSPNIQTNQANLKAPQILVFPPLSPWTDFWLLPFSQTTKTQKLNLLNEFSFLRSVGSIHRLPNDRTPPRLSVAIFGLLRAPLLPCQHVDRNIEKADHSEWSSFPTSL